MIEPDCKDCKWSRHEAASEALYRCTRPGVKWSTFCDIERQELFASGGACGTPPRYFEPRESRHHQLRNAVARIVLNIARKVFK